MTTSVSASIWIYVCQQWRLVYSVRWNHTWRIRFFHPVSSCEVFFSESLVKYRVSALSSLHRLSVIVQMKINFSFATRVANALRRPWVAHGITHAWSLYEYKCAFYNISQHLCNRNELYTLLMHEKKVQFFCYWVQRDIIKSKTQ